MDTGEVDPGDGDVGDAIATLELRVALIDLDDLSVRAVSGATLRKIDRPSSSVIGRSVLDLLCPSDHANAVAAFTALREGVVDFYRAHRLVRASGSVSGLTTTWVQRVEFEGRPMALVEATDTPTPTSSPLAAYLRADLPPFAIGTMSSLWKISAISVESEAVLGLRPEDAVGKLLVARGEQAGVRRAFGPRDVHNVDSQLPAVALHSRIRDSTGRQRPLCLVLTSLAGLVECLFIVMPDPHEPRASVESTRAAQLKLHLRRIAVEVAASGVLTEYGPEPELASLPQMQALSARQWEILARLLRGERVPTIAGALFISQSTVRNHLAGIFARFGVHSQPELLEVIRSRSEVSS